MRRPAGRTMPKICYAATTSRNLPTSPTRGIAFLIDRSLADPQVHSVALTTEEGVALLAGADLGGARGVLLLQSSGVGNCINMLSLTSGGRFPLSALVSMRGDFGEGNPWQFPMGGQPRRCWKRWASSV